MSKLFHVVIILDKMTFMLLRTKNTACVPDKLITTEQAVVKWILASLYLPSKLAIRYPAVRS